MPAATRLQQGGTVAGTPAVAPAWRLAPQVYTPASLNVVAQEIAETAEASSGPVACVCCPDLYVALRGCAPDVRCTLLDFNPSLNLAQVKQASCWAAVALQGCSLPPPLQLP